MQDGNNRPNDPRLKGVILHPKRLAILSYLMRKRGSGVPELGKALDLSSGQLGYHLKVLQGAGLVVWTEGARERGKIDRVYKVPVGMA